MGRWRVEPCWVARCNDCGLLGRLAKNGADLPLQEYVAESRRDPSIHRPVIGWCFKGRTELQWTDDAPLRTADVLREHGCPEFVRYRPGYRPDGLQELLMMEELRRIEAARDEARLAWQKDEERERREWQKDIEGGHRFDRRLIGGATLLVLIASVVVTALAAAGVFSPPAPPTPSSPYATILPIFRDGLAGEDGRQSTRKAPPERHHPDRGHPDVPGR